MPAKHKVMRGDPSYDPRYDEYLDSDPVADAKGFLNQPPIADTSGDGYREAVNRTTVDQPLSLRALTDLTDTMSAAVLPTGFLGGPGFAVSGGLALPGAARRMIAPDEDESRLGGAVQAGFAAIPALRALRGAKPASNLVRQTAMEAVEDAPSMKHAHVPRALKPSKRSATRISHLSQLPEDRPLNLAHEMVAGGRVMPRDPKTFMHGGKIGPERGSLVDMDSLSGDELARERILRGLLSR